MLSFATVVNSEAKTVAPVSAAAAGDSDNIELFEAELRGNYSKALQLQSAGQRRSCGWQTMLIAFYRLS